jgi:putative membrane protein
MEWIMKKHLLLAACISAAMACTSVVAQTTSGAGSQIPSEPDHSQIDRTFASQASAANLAEIQLGNLAASQGGSAAVRAFGNTMVADHTAANTLLNDLLNGKHVGTAAEPSEPQQKVIASLQTMSGASFDQRYARQAVKDHEDAIRLFTGEAAQGTDPDMRAFAAKMLPTLKQHLAMAKSLPAGDGGNSAL